jgi:phage regulator Rha-like protein
MEITLIQRKIHELRGQKIMLDFNLAELYEVETRVLKQAVRRNIDIFPSDFMFELNVEEWNFLRSQIVILEKGKGKHSKYLPFAFTEHGVTMLANVLNSKKARQTSVAIVRAFIALKQFILNYTELSEKLNQLESKYNRQFKDVYDAINYLLKKDNEVQKQKERKKIGYKSEQPEKPVKE